MGKYKKSANSTKAKFSVGTDRTLRSDPENESKREQVPVQSIVTKIESSQNPEIQSNQMDDEEQTLVEKLQELELRKSSESGIGDD